MEIVQALNDLSEKTIGFFRNPYDKDRIELVIEKDEHSFRTITIGDLLGLHSNTYPMSFLASKGGKLIIFEDWTNTRGETNYTNLLELKNDVYKLNDLVNALNK